MSYLMKRYQKRKAWAHEYLGNKCANCGSTSNLEIDHVDPTNKSFSFGKGWGKPLAILQEELNKCQLLCKSCHDIKTNSREYEHGNVRLYWTGCRCRLCTTAAVKYKKRKRF